MKDESEKPGLDSSFILHPFGKGDFVGSHGSAACAVGGACFLDDAYPFSPDPVKCFRPATDDTSVEETKPARMVGPVIPEKREDCHGRDPLARRGKVGSHVSSGASACGSKFARRSDRLPGGHGQLRLRRVASPGDSHPASWPGTRARTRHGARFCSWLPGPGVLWCSVLRHPGGHRSKS